MTTVDPHPADHRPASLPLAYGIPPPGFRLPAETRLGRVSLQVADLAVSLPYYQTVLGLQILHRLAGSVTLGAQPAPGATAAPLVELHESPGARPVPRRGRLGLYHFAILLPDRASLGQFLAHLRQLGARAGMSDHLVSEAIYLTDPDGLGIEVYADRPRNSWQVQGRQLAMATDPLDVEDLLAAGKGGTWSGAPAGATLGHVHLHVGDLERAEAFYHRGLGFDQMVWSYPGALFLSAGGYHHHLGTNTWAHGAEPAGPQDSRLLEWEVFVPTAADAHAALDSLRAVGAAVDAGKSGGTTRDPWGVGLRVQATQQEAG